MSQDAHDGTPRPRLVDPARSTAVLVGVTHYAHPDWAPADLPQVRRNVEALRDVLVAGGGFTADRVVTVLDDEADRRSVRAAVRSAFRSSSDTVVLYFAGHGIVRQQELHLALPDANPSEVGDETVSVRDLCDLAVESMPQRVVFLLDCCYAGAARSAVSRLSASTAHAAGTAMVAAVPEHGRAIALGGPGGMTLFTGVLVDALRTGTHPGPDLLTLQWLGDTARRAVRQSSPGGGDQLLPVFGFHGGGATSVLALAPNPALRRSCLVLEVRDHGTVVAAAAAAPSGATVQPLPDAEGTLDDVVARHVDGLSRVTLVHPSDYGDATTATLAERVRAAAGGRSVTVDLVPRAVALAEAARAQGAVTRAGERLVVVEEVAGEAFAGVVEVGGAWRVTGTPPTSVAGLPAEQVAQRRTALLAAASTLPGGRTARVLLAVDGVHVAGGGRGRDGAGGWPVPARRLTDPVPSEGVVVLDAAWRLVAGAATVRPVPGPRAAERPSARVPWPVGALGGALGAGGFAVLHAGLGVTTGVAATVGVAAAAAAAVAGRVRAPRS